MVNNGSLKYDHDTDGTITQISGCEAQFRNKPYETYVAIRYQNNALKVSGVIKTNSQIYKDCFSETQIIYSAMGCRIDPSWGGPILLFLVPASAPRLV